MKIEVNHVLPNLKNLLRNYKPLAKVNNHRLMLVQKIQKLVDFFFLILSRKLNFYGVTYKSYNRVLHKTIFK